MGILQSNRLFFIFILKFAGSYLLFSVLYWLYLSQYDMATYQSDHITYLVARQSSAFVNFIGEKSYIIKNASQAAYNFYVNKKPVAKIVEGCNALSVMILFTAFIAAFSTTLKQTSLYILFGVILLYFLNIVRIGLFTIALFYYKEHGPFLHDIIFPLFIYGIVFSLWFAWVTKCQSIKEDK